MTPSRAISLAYIDTSYDDDDDAPESVSIMQSKADVKRRDDAQQAAAADLKRKTKEKNRLKDENLKRRARNTRGESATISLASITPKGKKSSRKGKEPELSKEEYVERKNLEDRMARAMHDAQDEEDERDSDGLGTGPDAEEGSNAELEDMTSDEGEGSVLSEGDIAMKGIEEAGPRNGSLSIDYLPEHLFSEALSKPPIPRMLVSLPTKLIPKSEQKIKNARKRKSKDLVLGSKTVRTVTPKTNHISSFASRTLPPGKVKRFYEDRLSLKSKLPGKGRDVCYRKAANIGIMRSRSLPASSFERNS